MLKMSIKRKAGHFDENIKTVQTLYKHGSFIIFLNILDIRLLSFIPQISTSSGPKLEPYLRGLEPSISAPCTKK